MEYQCDVVWIISCSMELLQEGCSIPQHMASDNYNKQDNLVNPVKI